MKKYSVVAAFAAVSVFSMNADAQNTYQADQFRIEQCKITGMRAATAWKFREANDTFPMEKLPADNPMTVVDIWAINYAMHDAVSRDDAIRTSIAKCLDNVDKVFRYYRQGQFLSQDQLN